MIIRVNDKENIMLHNILSFVFLYCVIDMIWMVVEYIVLGHTNTGSTVDGIMTAIWALSLVCAMNM
jgi:hypothetical protein